MFHMNGLLKQKILRKNKVFYLFAPKFITHLLLRFILSKTKIPDHKLLSIK